jgi:hypothetical protein
MTRAEALDAVIAAAEQWAEDAEAVFVHRVDPGIVRHGAGAWLFGTRGTLNNCGGSQDAPETGS